MWLPYWNLRFDPFATPGAGYVGTPSHDEAVARLVATVESGDRRAVVRGMVGVGKSVVLLRAAREVRGSGRRLARVVSPPDEVALFSGLAAQIGGQVGGYADRAAAWRGMLDALRVCHWQGLHPVLIIDQASGSDAGRIADAVERLAAAGPGRLTIWQGADEPRVDVTGMDLSDTWRLAVRVRPLTRSESSRYLAAKLSLAGRVEPTFTPAALTLIHERAEGIPRGLERLAALGLRAGAWHSRVLVTPEMIEGVAEGCLERQADPAL